MSAQERDGGGGVITSVIIDVNCVVAKITMRVVAIGRDTSVITSGARSRAWPCNDEGEWKFHDNTNRKRMRRHGGVWATNAGHKEGGAIANVPLSEIVVPVVNAEDGEESKDYGVRCRSGTEDSCMEGRGWG